MPSLTETSSLATMEAMSTGLPVITTPVGHMRNYVEDNYNGFTCSTIAEEKKANPNVGLHITKENFLASEAKKKRPYPKRFDIAVPANMKCGKVDK